MYTQYLPNRCAKGFKRPERRVARDAKPLATTFSARQPNAYIISNFNIESSKKIKGRSISHQFNMERRQKTMYHKNSSK